jgi:hypothetical protein
MIIYGASGLGKTTLACGAPDPVVAWVEDGAGLLQVPGWKIETFSDMMAAIGQLYQEEHEYKTLVIDSLDWLERLIWAHLCEINKWGSIEDPGYGKGYAAAVSVWRECLEGLNALRTHRQMMIVCTAHTEIKRFDSPETEPYDRYQIKLHKLAGALMMEAADVIGFLTHKVSIAKADGGFGKKIARGVGGSERVLYLEERPASSGKNRYGMPSSITIPSLEQAWSRPGEVWDHLGKHIPSLGNTAATTVTTPTEEN